MSEPSQKAGGLNVFRLLGLGMELGLGVALPLICGIFVGRWLDGFCGTKALFTLILLFAGLLFGGYIFYRTLVREMDKWK